MPNFELPFPFGGLNDNSAQSKQPSGTSSDAVNVRGIDPITGRVRGAQRSGLLKYTNDSFEARVKRFEKVVYDNRQLKYEPLQTAQQEWQKLLPDLGTVVSQVVDAKENLYVTTSSNKLLKYNKNGVLVYTLAPAVNVANGVLKGVAVDDSFGVYLCIGHKDARTLSAGPSELGSQPQLDRCWIARYVEQQGGAGVPTLAWQVFPRCAVEKVIYSQGALFALGNDPTNYDGVLIEYRFLFGTGPLEASRRLIAYPATDFAIDQDQAIYWTAAPNENRYSVNATAYAGFRKSVVNWTPNDIDTSKGKVYSWFAADAILGYEDGEELLVWDDITNSGRDWVKNEGVTLPNGSFKPGARGPKYRSKAFGGKPCLEFDGAQVNALYSSSRVFSEAEINNAPIPNIANKATTIFMVVKPTNFDTYMYVGAFIYANKEAAGVVNPNLGTSGYYSYPLAPRAFAIGSGYYGDDQYGAIPVGLTRIGQFESTSVSGISSSSQDYLVSHMGPAKNAVNGSGFAPVVSGFGAGLHGQPYSRMTYSAQDAYIVTYTMSNRFCSNLSNALECIAETQQQNVPDNGVNVFDSLRINGNPLDRWFGNVPTRGRQQDVTEAGNGSRVLSIFGHVLGNPWAVVSQTLFLTNNVALNEDQSLPYSFNPAFPAPFTGYIAEMVVVTHDTQDFLPRYPRTIGLACALPQENLTRSGGFDSVNNIDVNYRAPILWPLGYINGPSGGGVEGIGNQRIFPVTRTGSQTVYAGSPSVLKSSNGFYYPVRWLDQVAGSWRVALNDQYRLFENTDAATNLVLNPSECQSQAVAHDSLLQTECEKIEGYLAWKYGIWHNLPAGNYAPPTLSPGSTYDPGNYPHPYRNQVPVVTGQVDWEGKTVHPTGVAACLESVSGPYRWAVNGATGQFPGGIGWSIAVDKDRNFYTYGPQQLAGGVGAKLQSAAVVSGGSGYAVGELLTLVGGSFVSPATCVVSQINASGSVLQVTTTVGNLELGNYTTVPSNPVSVTSSFGSGCTLSASWNYNDTFSYPADSAVARKLMYDGVLQQVSSVWVLPAISTPIHDIVPTASVDAFGNVCLPVYGLPSGNDFGFSVYGSNGSNPVLLVGQVYNEPINAALAERVSPTYRIGTLPTDDFEPNPTVANNFARAENLYIVGGNATADNFVERLLLVRSESDVSEPSPRAQALLAVSNGKIKRVDSINGIQSPVAAGTLPQPELDPDAPYVDSAILFGKVYFADGINYRVYDPRNDIVTSWDAQDAGSLPNRCKLLANWRGRAVLARGADDPHNWHMSEQGAPNNWDNFPPVSTATQAISGNNARAGLCPDLVNSLIPYNDDLLLFGCDSSLWMMRGDPMAGGVFDLVSDVTGVAFGRSWAKDPEGNLYFFGSRGGVYIMRPGGIPASMTQATIERRLTEVDLGQFYVEMFWNTYDDGLHLFLMPFTDTATHTKHFFWERRTGAWFQDEFGPVGNTAKQPSAAIVVDGDAPDDRCLLVGTYDSSLLKWDKNAVNDDSQIINSRVLIGPIAPDDTEMESRVMNLAAVLSNQGAVNYRLYASQTPDLKGEPVANGTLVPGRNPIHLVRARGAYVWIELGQANAATRWAMESLRMDAYPAGRKRNA